jgi:hypothetical protein
MRILSLVCVLWLSIPCSAQNDNDWGKLLNEKKIKDAEALCTSWTASPQLGKRVEAEKCLANVELAKGSQIEPANSKRPAVNETGRKPVQSTPLL